MTPSAPEFISSPYLIIDDKGWRLKPNAPKELQEQFKEFINSLNMDYEITKGGE